MHVEVLPELVSVPGVAGVWSFATSPSIRRPMFSEGDFRMTVCYLDDEPSVVGERLGPLVDRLWTNAPGPPLLAAPYESLITADWSRVGPPA